MIEHKTSIHWTFDGGDFRKGRYSRAHRWEFDGGHVVPASPSPHVVPAPWSDPAAVDPEEAFVAAIASCHMLTFLFLASRAGYQVTRYDDDAVGTMIRNERGRHWVNEVVLRPRIEWGGERGAPVPEELARLHHAAHEECYIANSVRTEVRVETPDA
ncbi:MAG: OsmC family protein [Gammaproteobacteria bacterium]